MENSKKEENRLIIMQWIQIFAILIMLIGAVLISTHLVINKIHRCTAQPFTYGANIIADDKNVTFHHGTVYLYESEFSQFPYVIFPFNITKNS